MASLSWESEGRALSGVEEVRRSGDDAPLKLATIYENNHQLCIKIR